MQYGIQYRTKNGWGDFKYKQHLSSTISQIGTANLKLYVLSMFFRGPVGELSGLPDGDYTVVGPDPRDPQWSAVLIKKGNLVTVK